MKKLLLLFVLVISLKGLAQSPPPNATISTSPFYAGEPFMAINPTDPKNIVIAYMTIGTVTPFKVAIKTVVSFDGGMSWGSPHYKPHNYSTWSSADVSMKFRNNGTVYLTYIDSHQPDSGGVYITHSTNGGINWSAPVRFWNANTEDPIKLPLDRPWLAVDNSTATSQGMMYVTTKPAPWINPPGNRPYLKSSKDSGATWSNYRYLDTTGHLVGSVIAQPMAAVCVAADGALCVNYPSYMTSQSVFPKIIFAKSYNKGGTFQYYDLVVNPAPVASSNKYKLGANMCAHPTDPTKLAFIGISEPTANDPDVFVSSTTNGGTTWSALHKINDDNSGKAQDMAWINYSTNNKLVACWRDRRNGTGTGIAQASDIYCAVSTDNGSTFAPNMRLSNITVPYDAVLDSSGNDFLCSELVNDTIYAVWGDIRNPANKINIYFTKTSINTGTGTKPILINGENDLAFFPNPAKDKVNFNSTGFKGCELIVYGIKGDKVLSRKIDVEERSDQLDVSSLKNSVYIITAEKDNRIVSRFRLVVER
jgi:hypothetical protein